jgi:hypothetical protein
LWYRFFGFAQNKRSVFIHGGIIAQTYSWVVKRFMSFLVPFPKYIFTATAHPRTRHAVSLRKSPLRPSLRKGERPEMTGETDVV